MNIRLKLTLFTTLSVVLTSWAILSITVYQHKVKFKKDIQMLNMLREKGTSSEDLVAMRISRIREDSAEIIRDRIIYAAVVVLVCVLVIFIVTARITRPINQLVYLTEEITSGRKSCSERITIESRDEIGRLTSNFNTLLGHIERSLATLKNTAEKYRELIENANSAIVRMDGAGTVLFFNEYAQKLFGYSPESVLGKPLVETIGKPSEECYPSQDLVGQLRSKTYVEVEHRAKNGRYLWIGWTIRPIAGEKDHREFLCVGSDITEKKKAENYAAIQQRKLLQSDKMATLGILASEVAHEINNPNNFIILNSQNFSEILKDILPVVDHHARTDPSYTLAGTPYTEIRPSVPILMEGITEGARRIKQIVETLMNFARQDSGELNEPVDLAKVIEAALLISSSLIRKTTAGFSVDIQEKLPPVRGNFQRLEQVVINLITNACQATDSPDKPIVVTAAHLVPERQVILTVSDQGSGISPDTMAHVFKPFFTTRRDSGGTGLGLTIVHSIIKDHGGVLKLESAPGRGTIATVLLPVS